MEEDIALVNMLKESGKKFKSSFVIIDRGDEESPLYKLIIHNANVSRFITFVQKFKTRFNINHRIRNWYICLFTDEKTNKSEPFTKMDNTYILNINDYTLSVIRTDIGDWYVFEFIYNKTGPYLEFFNSIDAYVHNIIWHANIEFPESIYYSSNGSYLKIYVKKGDVEKQIEFIDKLFNRFPFQLFSFDVTT